MRLASLWLTEPKAIKHRPTDGWESLSKYIVHARNPYKTHQTKNVGCTFTLSKEKVYKNLIRLKQNKPINDTKAAQ